jgi:hypothetical protein
VSQLSKNPPVDPCQRPSIQSHQHHLTWLTS